MDKNSLSELKCMEAEPSASVMERKLGKVEQLVSRLENYPDPGVRQAAAELVGTLIDLHGDAFEEIFRRLGAQTALEFAQSPSIGSVLLLHGLHPEDVMTRVRAALDKVRPVLQNHQGDVELLAVENGSVFLRLKGTCHGCPSSQSTFKNLIESAVYGWAPEVEAIHLEGGAH